MKHDDDIVIAKKNEPSIADQISAARNRGCKITIFQDPTGEMKMRFIEPEQKNPDDSEQQKSACCKIL